MMKEKGLEDTRKVGTMELTSPRCQDANAITKLKEADVYYSMGLVDEAIEAYRAILSSNFSLTREQKAMAEKRLRDLEDRDQDETREDQREFELARDVILTTEGIPSEGNTQAILDGAFALRELGLYDEAVSEYIKLFNLEYPPEKVVPEICKCLLRSSPAAKVKEEVSRLVDEYVTDEDQRAIAKFRLGLEMERISKLQYALELYQEAALLAPKNIQIKERIKYLTDRNLPKKQGPSTGIRLTPKKRRKWERINVGIPEFVFAEFDIDHEGTKRRHLKLDVANYSRYGLGLLVPQGQKQLLNLIRPGMKIENITFFARWAIIRVDAIVRHITALHSGPHKGQFMIGLKSDEIIESSVAL